MKEFKIAMFDFKINFYMSADEYKKKVGDNDSGLFYTVVYPSTAKVAIIVDNNFGDIYDPRYLQCLTHECTHAALSILDLIGIDSTGDNQEPLCYLQDFIFKRCYIHAARVQKSKVDL